MSERISLAEALEVFVPERREEPDWDGVLARAGAAGQPPTHRRAALAFAAAFVLAVGLLGATAPGRALVSSGVGWFSAWAGVAPGDPASEADEAAFSAASAEAYARFPSGTRVGLLLKHGTGERRLRLLGLRDGRSLCLWLVRSDLPGKRPPYCVPLSELERKRLPAAIAVAEHGIWLNENEGKRVSATFGVAADGIEAVELVDDDGTTHRVPVENNAFLFLRPHERGEWTADRWADGAAAIGVDGSRTELPYFQTIFQGDGGPRERPTAPGPASVDHEPQTTDVGWLERREPRGAALTLGERSFPLSSGEVVLARSLRPDPNSAVRIGVVLRRLTGGSPGSPGRPGEVWRCVHVLSGLASGPLSGYCTGATARLRGALEPPGPGGAGQQFAVVAGLASDAVARIELFLANGDRLPVPLADNAYATTVASVDFPVRLVAYDLDGHVIATMEQGLPSVPFRSRSGPRR